MASQEKLVPADDISAKCLDLEPCSNVSMLGVTDCFQMECKKKNSNRAIHREREKKKWTESTRRLRRPLASGCRRRHGDS